ncbi:MAG: glycosyltransferase [Candidatus Eisenbacteria bacterium]|nr:glycosyltransferase [Candidatus Eisenbacteria bacterium]
MSGTSRERRRLTVLALYAWPEFWSMGEGRGAPSFFLSITSFPRAGHDLHVVMPGPPEGPRHELYHGVHLHRFPTRVDFMPDVSRSKLAQHARIFFSYIYWFMRAVPAALDVARRVEPDVVFGMGALGATAARSVAVKLDVPNVTRLFGTSLGQFFDSPFRMALRYRERRAFRTPASYVVLHDDGAGGDEVARRMGVDMKRFLFWPNGIRKGAFLEPVDRAAVRRRLGVPTDGPVVLAVARLHPEKHVERMLRAAPRVLCGFPETTFVVVGRGPERGRLEDLARSLGIEDHVVFAGTVGQEELPEVYRSADVFVTMSDRTNAGNPLYEAMMAGLPVVALNTGRTAEVVSGGDNGLLIEPDELASLGDVVAGLLGDEVLRGRLGRRARETADAALPSVEERQAMEAAVVEAAAAEARGETPEVPEWPRPAAARTEAT